MLRDDEIIGHSFEGAIYCLECSLFDEVPIDDVNMPVMAGEEGVLESQCANCGQTLEDTL